MNFCAVNVDTYCSPFVEMLKTGTEPRSLAVGVQIIVDAELKWTIKIQVLSLMSLEVTYLTTKMLKMKRKILQGNLCVYV